MSLFHSKITAKVLIKVKKKWIAGISRVVFLKNVCLRFYRKQALKGVLKGLNLWSLFLEMLSFIDSLFTEALRCFLILKINSTKLICRT